MAVVFCDYKFSNNYATSHKSDNVPSIKKSNKLMIIYIPKIINFKQPNNTS